MKTRLIPELGAEGAAALATGMLRDTVAAALAAEVGPVELCCEPAPEVASWRGHLPDGCALSVQGDGDLGARLLRAAERATEDEPVLLIGTDCPDLGAEALRDAAAALAGHDAVLYPAQDGGYVLLGLNRVHPSLFEDIAWSTDAVARTTLERIAALDWTVHVGPTYRDIDEPADLA